MVALVRAVAAWRPAIDPVLLPALLAIAVGLLLAPFDGGYGGELWYPAGLFLLALLALLLAVAAPDRGAAPPRAIRFALVALVAFALWALLSATWSDVPALAWDGANRVLLYMIVLALVTLRPWPLPAFKLALGIVVAGLGTIALGVLLDAALSSDPASLFIYSRLSAPTGYANATANLWLIGVWPALALACGSDTPWTVRAGSLGISCLLLETSLLSGSRGALGAAAITALIFLALSGDRHKVLAGLAVVTGCTLLAGTRVFEVSEALTAAELEAALAPAFRAMAWTCVLATALGAAGILSARRVSARMSGRRLRLAWQRAARTTGLVAALVAVVVTIGAGDPVAWTNARWQDFKTSGYSRVETGSRRITGSLGSSRYDYYRVALNEFRDHPVAGIGYGSFQVPYLVHRRSDEAPRYTHSLAFGVLSQVGLIGALILVTFLMAVLTAARRALTAARGRRTLVAGALGGFTVWFTHGLVDWLWEFPALGIVGFALLGLAAAGCAPLAEDLPTQRAPQRPLLRSRMPRVRLAVCALAVLALAVSFVTLGLAARLTSSAFDEAPRDPVSAVVRLQRAAELDPLAAGPLLTLGVLKQRLGDRAAAQHAFERALEREPRNWFAHLQLGMLHATAGRRTPALRALGRAERLNPRQQVIDQLLATVRNGGRVEPADVERLLYAEGRRRLRAVPGQ